MSGPSLTRQRAVVIEREARAGVVPVTDFGAAMAVLPTGATRGAVVEFDARGQMHVPPGS